MPQFAYFRNAREHFQKTIIPGPLQMMKYVKLFIAILILIPLLISCGNAGLLERYDKKPEYLELIKTGRGDDQIICSSLYRVSGKYADITEEYFINNCDMGALVFACCGWELKNDNSGRFNDDEFIASKNVYRVYRVKMYSEETVIANRGQWPEIPYFYVLAEILEL